MFKCLMCNKKSISWPKMYDHTVTMHHPSLQPLLPLVEENNVVTKKKYGSAKTPTAILNALKKRGVIKAKRVGKKRCAKKGEKHRRKAEFIDNEVVESTTSDSGSENSEDSVDLRNDAQIEEDTDKSSRASSEEPAWVNRNKRFKSDSSDDNTGAVASRKRKRAPSDDDEQEASRAKKRFKPEPKPILEIKKPKKLPTKSPVNTKLTNNEQKEKQRQRAKLLEDHFREVDELLSKRKPAKKQQGGGPEQPPALDRQQQGPSNTFVDDEDIVGQQNKTYCPKSMPGLTYLISNFKLSKDSDIVRHSFFYAVIFAKRRIQNPKTPRKCKFVNDVRKMFKTAYPGQNFTQFPGVSLDEKELRRLDDLFKLRLVIYVNIDPAGRKKKMFYVRYIYTSDENDPNFGREDRVLPPAVCLYWYKGRYSCITNEDRFNNFFECHCGMAYWHQRHLIQHKKHFHNPEREETRRLKKESKSRKQKGCYKPRMYLRQRLENAGVPAGYLSNVQFPFFALFDIESLLDDKHQLMEDVIDGGEFVLDQEHIPMAIGVVCNFRTIKNGNAILFTAEKTPEDDASWTESYRIVMMIQKVVEHLINLSKQAAKLYMHRNRPLMQHLQKRYAQAPTKENERLIKAVINHSKQLPVLGYNSSRYDMCVLLYYGFFSILNHLDGPLKQIIKKNGYQMVVTQSLRLIDVIKFLAPGYTLRKFIKAFAPQVEVGKLWFPYEYVSSLSRLTERRFPPYEAFYSKLKQCNLLEEEYIQYQRSLENGTAKETDTPPKTGRENYQYLKNDVWRVGRLKTLGDFLRIYLNHDLVPFLPAVQNMLNYFQSKGVDAFKNHSTLPSTALPMLFASVPQEQRAPFLHLDREHHQLVRDAVQGGLAVIGTRWINCTENDRMGYPRSCIKSDKYGDRALPAKTIVGYDFNALYGGCLGTIDHYAGVYCIRNKDDGYKPKWAYEDEMIKKGVCTWLQYEEKAIGRSIQSAYNEGERQIFVKGSSYKVDGFDRRANMIYEYLGCYWHSHLDNCGFGVLDGDVAHPTIRGVTHKENNEKTMARIAQLSNGGYNIQYIWECHWQSWLNSQPNVLRSILSRIHESFGNLVDEIRGYRRFEEPEMLSLIKQGRLFGICVCDVTVPENMRSKYVEFPPIYVKVDNFTKADLPESLHHYAEENKLKPPKDFLTTKMSGQQCILPSEIVQFYLQKGFKVSNLTKFIQYAPGHRLFSKFLNERVEERRTGGSVISSMAKLLQNAAVGFTLMREDKLGKTTICGEKKFKQILTHKRVTNFENLGPMRQIVDAYPDDPRLSANLFVINQPPKDDIESRLPMVIGFKVLAMAKLHMLKFFEILQTYLRDETFEFLYSDTDSVYLALSESMLPKCVKPHLTNEWIKIEEEFFVTGRGNNDNSTSLVMKLEAVGTKFCALCPKMYVLCNENENIVKVASKGLPMKDNFDLITFQRFTAGIFEQLPPEKGRVTGIRNLPNYDGVYSYDLKKQAMNIIYAKRNVGKDSIHTYPLDYQPPYAEI